MATGNGKIYCLQAMRVNLCIYVVMNKVKYCGISSWNVIVMDINTDLGSGCQRKGEKTKAVLLT